MFVRSDETASNSLLTVVGGTFGDGGTLSSPDDAGSWLTVMNVSGWLSRVAGATGAIHCG